MNGLGCLFAIIFGFILAIGLAVKNIFNAVFDFKSRRDFFSSKKNGSFGNFQSQNHDTSNNRKRDNGTVGEQREKIFSKDEGEYIDFKEIK